MKVRALGVFPLLPFSTKHQIEYKDVLFQLISAWPERTKY